MYRWEVFLLVKCQTSCKYMHSQSMMIRTMLTALSLFHSHWTPMWWCSFVWIKVPVGLVLCTIGDTKPSSQQRMTLEPQTQLGKYFSVSLNIVMHIITYRAMWQSTVNFSSVQTLHILWISTETVFCKYDTHAKCPYCFCTQAYSGLCSFHEAPPTGRLPVMLKASSQKTQCTNETEIDSIACTTE